MNMLCGRVACKHCHQPQNCLSSRYATTTEIEMNLTLINNSNCEQQQYEHTKFKDQIQQRTAQMTKWIKRLPLKR